ncbi:hypothetical protein [Paenibacillus alginolyticus]|uniref:Uncharacterized protein n=1 Tax=Paenibacillus alginolyticus TaxID=59839 RepID=A0ABT4GB29_9BACL|nr:hypothetical protein [Paenibacillus alginolyticus]MCY9693383.1 hypothetical protein [Paenibacillus alginolyticus]MEC0144642.1 hypothetical protein [Paenibacillus alginolyticus]
MALTPDLTEPPMPPFMHGYVVGNYRDITFETQILLEEYLTLMTGSMGGMME